MSANATPKVALLVETARGYGRDFLRGVVRYARLHGPWSFYVTPGDFEQALPRMRSWGGTGIIARIETDRVARAILAAGLPTIALGLSEKQLRRGNPLSRLSEVVSDSHGAGGMAAEHLMERGLRHFGFVGVAGRIWSLRRQEGFCARLEASGLEALCFEPGRKGQILEWAREEPLLVEWLLRLPRPVGIMACNDDRGRAVLEACRTAGLRVPEEVAVVGVDNDELLCDLADPPLSSVSLNAEAGGYRAAELLDGLMQGRIRKARRIVVEPLRVVARRSSEVVAIADPDVAGALRYIQEHACEPISVKDVVKALVVSRRALEIRFRKETGRTIHGALIRSRLARAQQLLIETDLPVERVASATGFGRPSYLAQVFREHHGMTPAAFRRQARHTGASPASPR
ncbi:MAG: substrate-binding domain-containing protein [Isosphaeraceae bacterium]